MDNSTPKPSEVLKKLHEENQRLRKDVTFYKERYELYCSKYYELAEVIAEIQKEKYLKTT